MEQKTDKRIAPALIIRLGSHSEKEYIQKLARFLDGVIFGANLFEATPGATASLLISLRGNGTAYYLDPMTYAYGVYTDPDSGSTRDDLDWIKSEQVVASKKGKGPKKKIRDFKRSYRLLADRIGSPLRDAVIRSRAVTPNDLANSNELTTFCRSTLEYQHSRVRLEFESDPELKAFVADAPRPASLFAPYFFIEPTRTEELLALNLSLMRQSGSEYNGTPVHGVFCADVSHLGDQPFLDRAADAILSTELRGIWLWFSRFYEDDATVQALESYKSMVTRLSSKLQVYSLHGGFFSLALAGFGMRGVSHGVGYGEQKDVVPVIGQSTPTVRYYLPSLAKRLGIPDIERCFQALQIDSPPAFYEKVCGCVVCRGVVANSVNEFSAFGDQHLSSPRAKRRKQTPAAAKRCRYHFLITRIRERDRIRVQRPGDIASELRQAQSEWGTQLSLRGQAGHLVNWAGLLSPESR